MRLLEAIVEANHRALAGDASAGVHPADFADELPLVALTCIDVRLNRLLPQALGVAAEQFIWLRNAGNIITGPLSSTVRSLALACALKGAKSIAILGHTDCQVGKFTTLQLIERFGALGISRDRLPDNLNEYFGIFASEQANVIKGVDYARRSPLISPRVAVHGLVVDVETGRLDWLVNGYQALESLGAQAPQPLAQPGPVGTLGAPGLAAMRFAEVKIGDPASMMGSGPGPAPQPGPASPPSGAPGPARPPPMAVPVPPPLLKPKLHFRRGAP